ncbi:MAG: hypothetical protein JWP97_6407 [Labilithrix sp.]|nr:hypothetical protein [Labilithrix sp.]
MTSVAQPPWATRLVLGFDARVIPSVLEDTSSEAERRASLIREDVAIPLSVDSLVWPSVFPPDAAGWKGPVHDLWDSPQRLSAALLGRRDDGRFRAVAVALACEKLDAAELEDWRERARPTVTETRPPDWRSLGFDVADRYLTSGMVRIHSGASLCRLRAAWRARLNGDHLFSDVEDAHGFASECNSASPDHAPFFVYELLSITMGALRSTTDER